MTNARRIRLGAMVSETGQFDPSPEVTLGLATAVERAGWDAVYFGGHVVVGEAEGAYLLPPAGERQPHGIGRVILDYPFLEPLTTLAVLAGHTSRVALGTGILAAPLYPPVLLAKMAATVDYLCGGRLELGLSTGWLQSEYEAMGVPFAERGAVFDDVVGALRTLWQDSPASYSSPHARFDGVWTEPRPARPGGIKLLFGGELHARALRRITEHGMHWWARRRPDLEVEIARLRVALDDVGRDPDDLDVVVIPSRQAWDPPLPPGWSRIDDVIDMAERYLAKGATTIVVGPAFLAASLDEIPDAAAELATRFRQLAD